MHHAQQSICIVSDIVTTPRDHKHKKFITQKIKIDFHKYLRASICVTVYIIQIDVLSCCTQYARDQWRPRFLCVSIVSCDYIFQPFLYSACVMPLIIINGKIQKTVLKTRVTPIQSTRISCENLEEYNLITYIRHKRISSHCRWRKVQQVETVHCD